MDASTRTAAEAELEAPAALPKKKKLRHAGQHPAATGSVTFDRGTVADTAGLPRGAHKVFAIAADQLPPRAARAFLRCRVTLRLEEATGAVRGVDAEGADPGVSDEDLETLAVECMAYARKFELPGYCSEQRRSAAALLGLRRDELERALDDWRRAFPDALAPPEPFPPPYQPQVGQRYAPPPAPTAERVAELRAQHVQGKFQELVNWAMANKFGVKVYIASHIAGMHQRCQPRPAEAVGDQDLVQDAAALAALEAACADPGEFSRHLVQSGVWVVE